MTIIDTDTPLTVEHRLLHASEHLEMATALLRGSLTPAAVSALEDVLADVLDQVQAVELVLHTRAKVALFLEAPDGSLAGDVDADVPEAPPARLMPRVLPFAPAPVCS